MIEHKSIAVLLSCVLLFCAIPFSASAEDTVSFIPEFKSGKIYGIAAGSYVKDIEHIYYDCDVEVYNTDGNKVGSNILVGTGYKIKINGVSYYAVIFGDVDGNGKIEGMDYVMVKRAYFGNLTLSSLAKEAATAEPGEELRAIHYIMVKRAYFGTYDINRDYSCDPYDPDASESGWTPGWV